MLNLSVIDVRCKSDMVDLMSEDLSSNLDSAHYLTWVLVKLHNFPEPLSLSYFQLGVINEIISLKVPSYLKSIQKEKILKGKDRRLYKVAFHS